MTVGELLQRYVEHQAGRGRQPRTLAAYQSWLGKAVALWGAELECNSLTYQHCLGYRELGAHLAASTRSEHSIMLRQWLGWGHHEGFLWKNPAQDLRERCVRPKLSWAPSEDEVKSLLSTPPRDTAPGQRDAAMLELIYGTGLRRQELVALNLSDWQPDQGGVWVGHGKGGKVRMQPVGEHLARVLETYLEQTRPQLARNDQESALLLDDHGRRYPYYRVPLCLQHYCRRAGLRAILCQALRRAFATHMLLRGAALHEVQALLGHSNPDVTQRYTKIGVVELTREYRRTHPRATARISRRAQPMV